MKTVRITAQLFCVYFLLIGCSSKSVVINKDYENIKIQNGILLIPKLNKITQSEVFCSFNLNTIMFKNRIVRIKICKQKYLNHTSIELINEKYMTVEGQINASCSSI